MFQLAGDVMKIASWLFAFVFLSKSMTKTYISTEIIFTLSLLVLTVIFLDLFGLIGVTIAYAVNYATYLGLCAYLVVKVATLEASAALMMSFSFA